MPKTQKLKIPFSILYLMLEIKELIIYLTSKCNKSCKHCYLSDAERTTNPKELTPDDLKWIEENIRPKKVILMGGEPTLYKHFLLALEIFSDRMVTVATNGTIIDKFIPVLRKFDVEGIQLSVEGGRKETDELRGEGTWDMVLKKAKMLKKKGLNPYLRASFWSGNYKNLTEVMDAGEEIGIPVVFFPRIDKPPLPPGLTRDLFDKALSRKNCIIAMPNFFQYIGKKGRCGAGEERICVFYDKRITPCNLDLDYTLGRIGDDVESIKTNMKVFVENFKTIPAECIGCKNASVCKGSCYVAKAWLGCPLRYNVSVENYIVNYRLDREKVYEKAEMLTDFMRRVLVC